MSLSESPTHPASAEAIKRAARALAAGGLAAFPTETVYGLGGDAQNDRAVAAIYAAKQRPDFNPLIVHVADQDMAARYVQFTPLAVQLAETFWPGPLTLVLRRAEHSALSLLLSAGLNTAAIRVPAHPLARALLAAFGRGIAAPSANKSSRVSPTTAQHVAEEFPGADIAILDGGPCEVGIESTVVDATGSSPVILRPGSITAEMISAVTGGEVQCVTESQGKYASPGMLAHHYAPSIPVRLNATEIRQGEALLAFGPDIPPGAAAVLNLSEHADLTEAASHLFAYLRRLDSPQHNAIAVMPIPETGIGVAINDRLRRAAAPR